MSANSAANITAHLIIRFQRKHDMVDHGHLPSPSVLFPFIDDVQGLVLDYSQYIYFLLERR
jgi:hypothetical protein